MTKGRLVAMTVLLVLVTLLAGAAVAGEPAEAVLTVKGMFCASCAGHVEKALRELDGVVDARVELARDRVRVRYRPERVTLRRMAEILRKRGYELQLPPPGPVPAAAR